MQASNGVDGTLVSDGKAETMENGSVPEDKLTEDEDNEMSSPFSIPGQRVSLSHTLSYTCTHDYYDLIRLLKRYTVKYHMTNIICLILHFSYCM